MQLRATWDIMQYHTIQGNLISIVYYDEVYNQFTWFTHMFHGILDWKSRNFYVFRMYGQELCRVQGRLFLQRWYLPKNIKAHEKIISPNFFSGESWLGLENLHRLTSGEQSYSLKVTMTDYNGAQYVAVYDTFEVRQISSMNCSKSKRLCIYP